MITSYFFQPPDFIIKITEDLPVNILMYRTTVRGIGETIFSGSYVYGHPDNLKGLSHIPIDIDVDSQSDRKYNVALSLAIHELMHASGNWAIPLNTCL